MQEEIILKNFAERFSELVKNSDIDIQRLAEMIGIKSKSTIYRYMNAEMAPKIPTVKCLSEIFSVNPIWLMGYDAPMRTNNDKVNMNINIPVLGQIPAGIPMEMIEDIGEFESISEDMLKGGKEYFALKIDEENGHSMEPEYKPGDVLIVLKQDTCENGDDCIIAVNGNDATFKRVLKNENGIILQPLNSNYPPIIYSNDDIISKPVKILGVVVEFRRTKRKI